MKKIFLLVVFLLLSLASFAQKITLKGNLKDSTQAIIPIATIMLLNPIDSTLVQFTPTDDTGAFNLQNIAPANYILKITSVGYDNYVQNLQINYSLNLGTIILKEQMLKEIVIKGEKNPITIKQDTIEFNAGSFKTRPNASVEELLKKLPGVEVDREGNIKAQGQDVQKVLVNGKEFFGNDPKTATKNLPADAIEVVQILDKKSDQAAFTGIDDGQKMKTINLQTKNKDKKMSFGKFMAGAGTENRFEGKGNFNIFDKNNQFSVIGMGNNINQSGFTFNDYMDFMGQGQGGMGMGGGGRGGARVATMDAGGMGNGLPMNFNSNRNGGNFGILQNIAGGLNWNKQISNKLELNGSYFLSNSNNLVDKNQTRETFLPNNSFLANQNDSQRSINYNHRLNMIVEYKIDSLKSLKFTGNIGYNQTQNNLNSNADTKNNLDIIQNTNQRLTANNNDGLNYNLNLLYRQRLKKKGRTISTNLTATGNNQEQNGTLNATNSFFVPINFNIRLTQGNTQNNYSQGYGIRTVYTEPLANKVFLEFNHQYQFNNNEVSREVVDINGDIRTVNTQLTNAFDNVFQYNRVGSNIRFTQKKYNISFGLSGQFSALQGNFSNGTSVRQDFNNILPNMRLNYNFAMNKALNLNYDTDVREPSIQQLQPVINNTDPLNISKGNSGLRPEYNHRLGVNFYKFDIVNFTNLFAGINANYTKNAITTAQTITENFIRTSQPINTSGSWNVMNYLNYGFRINKQNRFNIGTNVIFNQSINVLNNRESNINQQNLGGNLRYDLTVGDKFDFTLRGDWSHQQTKYDFNANQNQTFFNETYTLQSNVNLGTKMWISTDMNYMIYRSLTNDFYQELPLWTASISAFVLKNNKGELKLSAVNLLDRNLGITQNAGVNYIQQERIASLGRFFMLSFTYSLSKISKPTERKGMQRVMMGGM
ncbi:MAG: TonB-dependent receptor [Bacteroidetes bacterium]|nr:MAG: TonB-dependent receptor [Bacteroidota bacterium]TAG88254.1 MAG: TonB-dependent receptor [Bacteroidota bacterium]